MKQMFNEYEAETSEGQAVADRLYVSIKTQMTALVEEGFSVNDVELAMLHMVSSCASYTRLCRASAKRRAEKESKAP